MTETETVNRESLETALEYIEADIDLYGDAVPEEVHDAVSDIRGSM